MLLVLLLQRAARARMVAASRGLRRAACPGPDPCPRPRSPSRRRRRRLVPQERVARELGVAAPLGLPGRRALSLFGGGRRGSGGGGGGGRWGRGRSGFRLNPVVAPVGWAAGAGTGARAAAAAAARAAREAGQRFHPGAHVAAGLGGGGGQGRRGHVRVVEAAHRRRRRGLGGHRGPRGREHGRFRGKTTRGELGGGGRAVGHTCGPALRAGPGRSEACGEHLVALMAYERVHVIVAEGATGGHFAAPCAPTQGYTARRGAAPRRRPRRRLVRRLQPPPLVARPT